MGAAQHVGCIFMKESSPSWRMNSLLFDTADVGQPHMVSQRLLIDIVHLMYYDMQRALFARSRRLTFMQTCCWHFAVLAETLSPSLLINSTI